MSGLSLQRQSPAQVIAWAFIPAAVLLVAVAVLNYSLVGRVTEDLVTDRNADFSQLLAEQIAVQLEELAEPLRTLANSDEIHGGSPSGQQTALINIRDELWDMDAGVVILDHQKRVTAADARRLDLRGTTLDIPYPTQIFPVVTASDMLSLGRQQANTISLIVPIWQDASTVRGVVAGFVSISRTHARGTDFYRSLKQFLFDAGDTVYLIDGGGRVIYHPDTWQIGTSRTLSAGRSTWPDGEERLISMATIPGTNWRVVVEEDWSALIAASAPYRWLLIVLLGLGLLLPGIVVWVALRNVQLYARAEAEATLAERRRLAADLHDAVSQTLFAINMISGTLPRLWERHPDEASRQLSRLHTLTRGAQSEMRTLLLELRPEALEAASLTDLLDQLVRATAGRELLTVQQYIDTDCTALPMEVKIALYRIAQEALNNIAKHARAENVTIQLHCENSLTLLICDDGCGFDPTAVSQDHLGQRTMRERAEAINAELYVYSTPGAGTEVCVKWSV